MFSVEVFVSKIPAEYSVYDIIEEDMGNSYVFTAPEILE